MTIELFREQSLALFAKAERIVITSHMSPDDDSIGSVLAAREFLVTRYPQKEVRIIYTGTPVSRYAVFDDFDCIEWVDDITYHVAGVELLLVLDVSHLGRVSKSEDLSSLRSIPTIVSIDHHKTAPDEATTLAHIDPALTSNAELFYRVFETELVLTKKLASYILCGILGDTGNFSFVPPEQASNVFSLASRLVETAGVGIDQFRSQYGGIPKSILPLLQQLVANTAYKEVPGWPTVQYSWVDRTTGESGQFTDEDMSAASHIYIGQYLPRVEGQPWGFVATPRSDGGVRVSGRSLPGSVNVRDMFESMGIGGGHDRASGANFPAIKGEPMESSVVVEKLFAWMRDNSPILG